MTSALALPYPPGVNHLYAVARGRKILSREGRIYRQRVGWLCMMHKVRPLDGPVVVSVVVYRPRRSGDLDNALKSLLDSLKGYLFHDDAQVVEIHARRDDDKANPRAEVRVEPAEAER